MKPAPVAVCTGADESEMNIHVEYDAATLVSLGLTHDPACDGVILKRGEKVSVLASTVRNNPLAEGWLADLTAPGDRIVCWSGTLAPELFDAHPMTWLPPGREAFATFCDDLTGQLEKSGKQICFHPHSRHVLCDPASCLSFCNQREGEPFEIALAPADLFEPVMLDDIEDHLTRAFEMLGSRCAMVMLSDVALKDREEQSGEESCHAVPLGQGSMPRDHVRKLIEECLPPDVPIVLMPQEMSAQLAWLGA